VGSLGIGHHLGAVEVETVVVVVGQIGVVVV